MFENHHFDVLMKRLHDMMEVQEESLAVQKAILKALRHPTEVVSLVFEKGGTMQTIPVGKQDQGFITCLVDAGDGNGAQLVAALPNGQTIGSIVSVDPASCSVALDSPAAANPDGTASVGSFVIKALN